MKNLHNSKDGQRQGFKLDDKKGYFINHGVNVMAFSDAYPEGHQSGLVIIMHGNRVATNGDIRFEQTPGQWQPVPRLVERELDVTSSTIRTKLAFPDTGRHLSGFNPMVYPDFDFSYKLLVTGLADSIKVTVDLDRPIPEKLLGKLSFNLELYPASLFGKAWIMDEQHGIFPRQANGPVMSQPSSYLEVGDFNKDQAKADLKKLLGEAGEYNPIIADDLIAEPYAVGKRLTIQPDDPYSRLTIESRGADLKLYDGRMNHNNGWFVISSEIPAQKTNNAIEWIITPSVVKDWLYPPVVQISQVGYHPNQSKVAIIELDNRDRVREKVSLLKIEEGGERLLYSADGLEWGHFLRYNYLKFDFTHIREPGLYKVRYGQSESSIFRIAKDVYDRGIWQPVLEYFLPVQMCHMRVNEKYRVWHGLCHDDDARMAPVDYNHFDGYKQGPSTLTEYEPGQVVPGLNVGGWHDAGDFDIRVESQSGEFYTLALAYEAFKIYYDATTIDQERRVTEIHQPDGKNDILQQIEHGVLSVVAAYCVLGRLYRGIIENDLRQYVHLGDSSTITDGIKGNDDDRWVFTEDNPQRQLTTAAHLAAASRALKGFNDSLSQQALEAASELFETTRALEDAKVSKIHAATELFLTTGQIVYSDFLQSEVDFIVNNIERLGWILGRAEKKINNKGFSNSIRQALTGLNEQYTKLCSATPYGVPYSPSIWGAGWNIQRLGVEYYFLHKAYPDIFQPEMIASALNFVLGCHPGSNTMSFVSGVGTKSATTAYGINRADWSFIPGGVISGTALIRPDFPELLEFPYLWQQAEYVLGGASSNFMFLVLAVREIMSKKDRS